MSKLYLITGPAGVGKSTISKKLAEKQKKSALIEGDDIYNMIIGGHVSPWKKKNTLDIMWDISTYAIKTHLKAGFDVVFNYIIDDKRLAILKKEFIDDEIIFVVLMADEKEIIKRDLQRPKDCQMNKRAIELLAQFKKMKFKKQYVLETTYLSIDQVVEKIKKEKRFEEKEFF